MTSQHVNLLKEGELAKFRATTRATDATAQASGGAYLQWVLMKDVDKASGYQTPSPPKQAPEYEGQVVAVPAAPVQTAS